MSEVFYFSAAWCNPCRVVSPMVEKLREEYPEVTFKKVDVDDDRQIAADYKVKSIPCIVHVQEGKEVGRVVGSRSNKEEIASLLQL